MTSFYATDNTALTCIEVDAAIVGTSPTDWYKDAGATYSASCTTCTVNIPDANFKTYLVGNSLINTNGDTEIQCSEASAFTGAIVATSLNISDLIGIEAFTALTELYCNNNQLTSLDVSANTSLQYLFCSSNQLTSLDVSNNTALIFIDCKSNQLTSLDGSVSTALTQLKCDNNLLTSLDVSNNTALTSLECYNNNITSLDLSTNTALTTITSYQNNLTSLNIANGFNTNLTFLSTGNNPSLACIQVDANIVGTSPNNWYKDAGATYSVNCATCIVNIPDANFKTYLVANTAINTNGDTEIQCSEASAFTGEINIQSANITDMTGLEVFTALTSLKCNNNLLTTLDLSGNTALTALYCGANQLTALDVSVNTSLITLSAFLNSITTIDVSSNTALEFLSLGYNSIASIDVSSNVAMKEFYINNNNISAVDITNLSNLEILIGTDNQISALDVTNNTMLTTLEVGNNQISNLDLTNNTQLSVLECYANQLTALDVSNNLLLTELICGFNQIPSLDLSAHAVLNFIACQSNNMTSLNVANGNNSNIVNVRFRVNTNPNLTCITVDDVAYSDANWANIDLATSFSLNCSAQDNTAPTAVCQNITVQLGSSGNVTITPAQIDGGSTDDVAIASIVVSQTSFDCSSVGSNTVTITVTDTSGNTDTCTATITVEDSETPVITNATTITANTDTASCNAVVAYTQIGVTDNCTGTLSFDIPSGSTFAIGTTTVTATATDASNNTSTATFDVVVEDNEAPVISCPSNEVVMVPQGDTYTLPNYITNGNITATDNCNVTITQTPVAGTQVAVGMQTVSFQATDGTNIVTCSFELTVDEILGVNTVSLQKAVSMYPNPATHTQ